VLQRSKSVLTEHHAMKAYWGVEVQLYYFLTSALDGSEWLASRTGRFTPKERAPVTHWIAGWVRPRAGLETVVKRKTTNSCRDSNLRSSSPQPSAIPLSYPGSYYGGLPANNYRTTIIRQPDYNRFLFTLRPFKVQITIS
jgi:hypothetical protein